MIKMMMMLCDNGDDDDDDDDDHGHLGTVKSGVEPKFLEIGTTGMFWKMRVFSFNLTYFNFSGRE